MLNIDFWMLVRIENVLPLPDDRGSLILSFTIPVAYEGS
jgi:hypothetical protein